MRAAVYPFKAPTEDTSRGHQDRRSGPVTSLITLLGSILVMLGIIADKLKWAAQENAP